jgi:NAD(P)-dependent dehydrogenase (short-subunit alcohol dehydrogenase family)
LWLFTQEGFYSMISAESNAEFQDALCARARRRKDLVRLKKALGAGAGPIRSTPRRDYPFRMDVDRERIADHVRRELASIRYSNFKDRVEKTQGREALVMFAKALAMDLAPYNIRVNAICPGIIDTPLFRASYENAPDPEGELARIVDRYLIKHPGAPDDIAYAALYLTGEESAFVTGAALAVDGGRTFH